jgi:hypothetical protein
MQNKLTYTAVNICAQHYYKHEEAVMWKTYITEVKSNKISLKWRPNNTGLIKNCGVFEETASKIDTNAYTHKYKYIHYERRMSLHISINSSTVYLRLIRF